MKTPSDPHPTDSPFTCPQCGSALAGQTVRGLCPKCLALVALGSDADATMESASSIDDLTLDRSAAGSPARPASQPALSATVRYFGDYELLDEIARGGMGVVFKARQKLLNRIVALKMILSGSFASDAEVKRFRAEAEAVANLDHPNIVPIYEVGEHEGRHYFSMKLMDGGSIAERVAESRHDLKSTAGLMAKVARAVHYAHQRGILHRDLKPANILLDAKGEPHVTDFGLAKLVNQDSGLTRSEAVLGTPNYMAPEQAAGRSKQLSTGADIFSLGAILYHMLTSRPPFRADTPLATMKLVVESEPPRPSTLNARTDRDMETICLKCLEKDPKRRYGSAESLAEDLERWLRNEPIAARPSTAPERIVKWAQRKPALAAMSVVIVGVAIVGVLGIELQRRKADAARGRAENSAFTALVGEARAERLLGHRDVSLERIAEAAKLRRTPELRAEAIQAIAQPGLRRVFDEPFGSIVASRFSPDGTLLAIGGDAYVTPKWPGFETNAWQSLVRVWDLASRKLLCEVPWRLEGGPFDLSPDARLIAVPQLAEDGSGEIALRHARGGAVITRLPAFGVPRFSPDGKWLAVQETNRVSVWHRGSADFSPPQSTNKSALHNTPASIIAWTSPDEVLLWNFATNQPTRLVRWNLATGQQTFPLKDGGHFRTADGVLYPSSEGYGPDHVEALAVSGDGRVAVIRHVSPRYNPEPVHMQDLATGKLLATVSPPPPAASTIHLSPDGRRLMFADSVEYGRMRVFDVTSGRFLAGVGDPGTILQWGFERFFHSTNHGSSGSFRMGEIQMRHEAFNISTSFGNVPKPDAPWASSVQNYNPNGTLFAAGSHAGQRNFTLWELDSGRRFASIPTSWRPVWSADGRWLEVYSRGLITFSGTNADGHGNWSRSANADVVQVSEVVHGVPTHHLQNGVSKLAFSADGRQLTATVPEFGSHLWDVEQGRAGTTLRAVAEKHYQEEVFLSTNAAWAVNSLYYVYGGAVAMVRRAGSAEKPLPLAGPEWVLGRGLSPDGQRLLLACSAPKWDTNAVVAGPHFQLWDLAQRKRLAAWPNPGADRGHGEATARGPLVFSPDGRRVASRNFTSHGIEIWDATTGKRLHDLRATPEKFETPPQRRFQLPPFLRIFGRRSQPEPNAPAGRPFEEWDVKAIAFTPDGRLVVSCAQDRAVIREVESGRELAQCRAATNQLSLAVSPDGRTLATGGEDHVIRIWEVASGRELAHWPAHDAPVEALAISPDGATLASGARDGTMKLWNLPFIRKELASLKLDW